MVSHLADDSVVVMVGFHGGGRNIEGASPDFHLGLSVLGSRLCLVQARQTSVVTLIQPPGPMHGHPHLVDAVQDMPQCPDGPLQDRGVADVKLKASVCVSKKHTEKVNKRVQRISSTPIIRAAKNIHVQNCKIL